MSTVQPGSRVTLHYRITLADGQIMDASGDEPFSFVLGDGNLDPGLEAYLIGLEVATQREFSIEPGEVFPWPVASAVHQLPRSDFAPDMRLEPGLIYEFTTPAGDAVPGSIVAVTDDQVTVDFNHPLAGQALRFWVEICAVE